MKRCWTSLRKYFRIIQLW